MSDSLKSYIKNNAKCFSKKFTVARNGLEAEYSHVRGKGSIFIMIPGDTIDLKGDIDSQVKKEVDKFLNNFSE